MFEARNKHLYIIILLASNIIFIGIILFWFSKPKNFTIK